MRTTVNGVAGLPEPILDGRPSITRFIRSDSDHNAMIDCDSGTVYLLEHGAPWDAEGYQKGFDRSDRPETKQLNRIIGAEKERRR